MIPRSITPKVQALAQQFPALAILGPRQSGKTTLAQQIFSEHTYVLLEELDMREFATRDPRGFLETYRNKKGLILDEIQYVPSLFSYIQGMIDREKVPGYFILTGSQNYLLNEAITQSLAGRIAIFTLLPFSTQELLSAGLLPQQAHTLVFQGGYPRIYNGIAPADLYPNYLRTYVERDVRQIKNITDLVTFQRFIKLVAGRIGQLVNITSLANDCGINTSIAKSWLSLLETSYIIFTLQPHYNNFSKRLVKTPKIYFYDTGLAAYLLEIDSEKQLVNHYLWGGLFESFIIADFMKEYYNRGRLPRCYFWRDKTGKEVDCLIERADKLIPIEIKAGQTVVSDYFNGLDFWNKLADANPANGFVVYAGAENQQRERGNVVAWNSLDKMYECIFTIE